VAVALRRAVAATLRGEIVPAFNAYLYFEVAIPGARARSNHAWYRVRLGHADSARCACASQHSVVFVMKSPQQRGLRTGRLPRQQARGDELCRGEWARVVVAGWLASRSVRSRARISVRRGAAM